MLNDTPAQTNKSAIGCQTNGSEGCAYSGSVVSAIGCQTNGSEGLHIVVQWYGVVLIVQCQSEIYWPFCHT